MIDLLIKNGKIVTPETLIKADIAIEGEKILGIGASEDFGSAKEIYDASEMLILPGLIDPHVHMNHPYKGEHSLDDAYHTSVSAAFGGSTTVLDFAIQWDKNLSLPQVVEWRRSQIDDQIVVDYGLHAVPTKSEEITIIEADGLVNNGIPSFKIYMVYRKQGRMVDDAVLYELLSEFSKLGGTLMVHAENNAMSEYNQEIFSNSGRISASDFPDVKPNVVEAEAINRALYFCEITGGQLYIVHLSTQEGLEMVEAAKLRGVNVIAETCPHYLTLTDEVYSKRNGGRFICSPPLRSDQDVKSLWKGIASGVISTIGSDHCGFGREQKDRGKGNFMDTPHGLPGIEARLPLIYTEGVRSGIISLNQLADLLSTNPAKVFGIFPQKGALLPGSDADLAILDIERSFELRAKDFHGAVDWSPYEGMEVYGMVKSTVLRGNFIVKDHELMASQGFGKFLHRNPSSNQGQQNGI